MNRAPLPAAPRMLKCCTLHMYMYCTGTEVTYRTDSREIKKNRRTDAQRQSIILPRSFRPFHMGSDQKMKSLTLDTQIAPLACATVILGCRTMHKPKS